ncbi:uncharacterized protein LODBEIA_P34580 [Lodderomyces beijingensis]|uniref:Mediator of RNA polymerase II transcription subunit 6 n=1 Tax=Lodderomyces beijingensis TaxID=1775926 RepID=A0ABP0ZM71_9ASCO
MEALDEIQWKSPEFIQERGLNTQNVLEYFSLSPFYDRTSNNQVLMMQFQYQQIQIPHNVSFHQYFQSRLAEMTGVEFIIAYVREPDFWVVRKQRRYNPNSTRAIQDYYIVGANVYQAPKIFDVLSSRILASVLALKRSAKTLNEMTSYHISDGGHSFNNSVHGKDRTAAATTAGSGHSNTETPISLGDTPIVESTAGLVPNTLHPQSGISSGAFDALLTEVTNETSDEIYLDDIPLYGPGSTVELLGVQTNNT